MRDVTLEDTVRHGFTTRAFATGIPTVLAGTPVLSVLEENNATPITAGVSVSVSRASVVGLNEATVLATAANGYEVGKNYSIYISTGTVGGVSVVGEVVGQFQIQASAAAVDLANVTDGLGAIKADTAATLIDTIGLNGDAMRGTDNALLAADLNTTAGAVDNVTLVATTTTNTDMRGTDSVDTAPMRGTDSAALAAVATEARLAELDAANLPAAVDSRMAEASINTTVGAVDNVTLVATTTVNTDMRGTDGANTVTPLSAAQVNAEVDTALNTAVPGAPVADSVNDTIQRTHRSVKTVQEFTIDNTVFTATATQAQVDAVVPGALEATDDHYNGRIMIFTSGANIYQATDITDYDGLNKRFTYTALTDIPANNDTFVVI